MRWLGCYRPMTAQLHRQGIDINRKRVLRLMRTGNLLSLRRQAFVRKTTESAHGFRIAPNFMRDLIPTGLNQIWVADITPDQVRGRLYARLAEVFVYLAIVLDAFSRRMIGWALEDHLRAELAVAAPDRRRQRTRQVGVQNIRRSRRACTPDRAICRKAAKALMGFAWPDLVPITVTHFTRADSLPGSPGRLRLALDAHHLLLSPRQPVSG